MKLSALAYTGTALALSLALNAGLLYQLGVTTTRGAWKEDVALKDRDIARLQGTIRVNEALAQAGAEDHADLLRDLNAIADRGQLVRTQWRTRTVPGLPALDPNCAPGTARQAAFNWLIAHPTTPLPGGAP